MTTPVLPKAPFTAPAGSISRPFREASIFVGLVTLMILGVALALPHAHIVQLLTMVSPLVAVLLITVFGTPAGHRAKLWGSLGLRRPGLRSWPAAIVVSAAIVFVVPYAVADLLGSIAFKPLSTSIPAWLDGATSLAIGIIFATILAFTEEIGWRGYLLPRIQALVSKRRAALIVGFLHGMFHVPLMVFTTTYNSIGSRWIVVPTVVATVTAAGVFYAWLKERSGSVWPVALAHGTVNALIDGLAYVAVLSPVAFAYTATESGFATLGAAVVVAVILLVRGRTYTDPRSIAGVRGVADVSEQA
jgi:membrane protease YdiL (CAAX protease family)